MHASHDTVYYVGVITVFIRIMSVITTNRIISTFAAESQHQIRATTLYVD